MERLVTEDGDVQVRLERVELAAIGIAPDLDIEEGEDGPVAIGDPTGEEDHPGAGAPHRRTGGGQAQDRLGQAVGVHQASHGGRLAAGQDQGLDPGQVAGEPDFDRLGADLTQGRGVLGHVPLHGQDADPRPARRLYQPREASRSWSGISASSRPRIGSPRPALTSARISGLS